MSESVSQSSVLSGALAPSVGESVCERLLLSAFSRMTRGYLRMTLPDGRLWEVGSPEAELQASIVVKRRAFFEKCVWFGDVGFGEAYVDGDWETESIEAVIRWAILNVENSPGLSGSRAGLLFLNLLKGVNRIRHRKRRNSVQMSRRNIADHYDLGNEFYELWLDETMTYSSGLFETPGQSLESAQSAKYEALCRGVELRSRDHVLEIGSGWGGFCVHAAKHHGCRVTSITISQKQFEFVRGRIEREGLSNQVDVQLRDYREVSGRYDKVVSIEMMEALGDRYLETFFGKIHEVLSPEGLVGLQYITVPDSRHRELRRSVDWIQKHIFPGSLLLSVGRVNRAVNRTGDLFLHELRDLGASYARTLRLWLERFQARQAEVLGQGFDEAFLRKWSYYLQYCEAAFASRNISVVQAIYTRPNNVQLHRNF
jgi:cyclopropane-fatty-acyl-phospholipid synthase